MDRPNILFVCVDQWRADCLGFAGHPVVETPHLDRLALDSVNFTQAYTSSPSCIASRAAMLTGLSQRHHGFVGYQDGVNWDYDISLPQLLTDAGYQTQCIGKMHVSPARNAFGFQNVILHDGYLHMERYQNTDVAQVDDYLPWLQAKLKSSEADYIDTGLGCNGYAVRPWIYDEALHPTTWVTTQGVDFLRRRDPTRPFFLMMSYHRPHPPLDPPKDFLERYLNKSLPDLPLGDWVDFDLPRPSFDSPIPQDSVQIDLARRAYYAQISHLDFQLNRMLMALFSAGELANTAIVFTSDHGDMLYDHHQVAKSVPFDGSARIPLMIRPPAGSRKAGFQLGQSIDDVVELRDLLPTFCDIAKKDVPDGVDGRSLINLCKGEANNWREFIHGEHTLRERSTQWVTDGKEKYVWFSQTGRELLFDLVEDPQELRDVSNTRQARTSYWRARLVESLDGREEGFVQNGELVAGQQQQPVLKQGGKRLMR